MQKYINRFIEKTLIKRLQNYPAVAILGPRQCGKSTLAKYIIKLFKNSFYLDLEKHSDLNKLRDPEAFFQINKGKLICIDEVQRYPDLFVSLRSVIDENNANGQFLILGSASLDLIKQSSESLAGRISFIELPPFLINEIISNEETEKIREHWLKGGFPRSFLASDTETSFQWREDFIKTFLERDLNQLGFNLSSSLLHRFWQMCAHINAQIINKSKLGDSLGVNSHTISRYIDLLENTFMIRVLRPYFPNLKKRIIKSPKLYIRDTGLLHNLLGIETQNDLLGHPIYGASWEGFVIENIVMNLQKWRPYFYRTSDRTEIDLVLERGERRMAIECKVSTAPKVGRGFFNAIKDLEISESYIIAPVDDIYPYKENVFVSPLSKFLKKFLQE